MIFRNYLKLKSLLNLILILLTFALNKSFSNHLEGETKSFALLANLNGSFIKGNFDRDLVVSNLDFTVSDSSLNYLGFRSANNYQLGYLFNRNTENDLLSRNFVYIFQNKDLYPYLMYWAETNLRKKINQRHQIGLGLSYKLIDDNSNSKNNKLKISFTFTKEFVNFDNNNFNFKGYTNSELNFSRFTIRAIGHFDLTQTMFLDFEAWQQQDISNIDNYRTYFDLSMNFKIYDNVSFRVSSNYNKESMYVKGLKPYDFITLFGLGYKL